MLRPANEHEEAAFLLVERTIRRMRPLVTPRGLEALTLPHGKIERSSLGRLRFRFNGNGSDFEPENRIETRPLSEEEASWWADVRRMVDVARPVADPRGNLVSMRIGQRVLRRLPLGRLVTFLPDGTPPFIGSLRLPDGGRRLPSDATFPILSELEKALLAAIDAFVREDDGAFRLGPRSTVTWSPPKVAKRPRYPGAMAPLGRGRIFTRSKWHKCPICRAPVVKGRFNPRIPFGTAGAGVGSIRDLRGGYLSRLRETYILEEPGSVLEVVEPKEETPSEPSTEPAVET